MSNSYSRSFVIATVPIKLEIGIGAEWINLTKENRDKLFAFFDEVIPVLNKYEDAHAAEQPPRLAHD